jgi:hypothetical protein
MTTRNSTDAEDADDLRRSFMLAMSDAIRGDKVNASMLEVCRKYLADVDAERRWQVEQAALVASGSTVDLNAIEVATSGATAPTPSRIVAGVNLDQLPFPVTKRGVEYPPAKPAETDHNDSGKPTTTWEGLSQVPFMAPND